MSLESGVMLWRLNQELFPDPGSPMARTTVPFEARGALPVSPCVAPRHRSPEQQRAGHFPPRRPWKSRRRVRSLPPVYHFSLGPLFPVVVCGAGRCSHLDVGFAAGWRALPRPRRDRADAPAPAAFQSPVRLFLVPLLFVGAAGAGTSSRIVIGGLKRGLCRLALTSFRILFGALETIAHPLAHLWFVTQLHIAGNPASPETYQSCQPVGGVARAPPCRAV